MRSQRRLVRPQTIEQSSDIIFDTSGFYSNSKKFSIMRSSDSAILDFTPTEVTDGTYSTWLDGSTGYVQSFDSDLGSYSALRNGNPILKTNGVIRCYGGKLLCDFDDELPNSFIVSAVFGNQNNIYNQRYEFGVGGLNSGFTLHHIYSSKNTFFGCKTIDFSDSHKTWLGMPPYNNAIQNVIVVEIINGVTVAVICNGTENTIFSDTTNTNTWVNEISAANKISLGGRVTDDNPQVEFKNFGVYISGTKTRSQISNELISIHQT